MPLKMSGKKLQDNCKSCEKDYKYEQYVSYEKEKKKIRTLVGTEIRLDNIAR